MIPRLRDAEVLKSCDITLERDSMHQEYRGRNPMFVNVPQEHHLPTLTSIQIEQGRLHSVGTEGTRAAICNRIQPKAIKECTERTVEAALLTSCKHLSAPIFALHRA